MQYGQEKGEVEEEQTSHNRTESFLSVDNISVEIRIYGTYVLFRIRRMNICKNKTFIITERYNYYGTIKKTVLLGRHAMVFILCFIVVCVIRNIVCEIRKILGEQCGVWVFKVRG